MRRIETDPAIIGYVREPADGPIPFCGSQLLPVIFHVLPTGDINDKPSLAIIARSMNETEYLIQVSLRMLKPIIRELERGEHGKEN